MKLFTLKIKNKTFRVLPVTETEEMKKGLAGKPKLGKGKGMMFHFGEPQEVTMNMVGMRYPLDMLFIDGERKVKKVQSMSVGMNEITVEDVMCVLEINKGEGKGLEGATVVPTKELEDHMMSLMSMPSKQETHQEEPEKDAPPPTTDIQNSPGGFNIVVKITSMPSQMAIFKKGGSFKMYEEDVKMRKGAMQVLDDTGRVLMNIDGGERIFSIEDTDNIINLSKKIDRGEANEEDLGKLMAEIIHRQNTQEPEYV